MHADKSYELVDVGLCAYEHDGMILYSSRRHLTVVLLMELGFAGR